MRNYSYPDNLAQKPLIFLWGTGDITILMIAALISITQLLGSGNVVPSVFTVCYGILTAQFAPDVRPAICYFKDLYAYLSKPQIWMYDYSLNRTSKTSASEKDVINSMRTDDGSGDNNLIKLVSMLAICAIVTAGMIFAVVSSKKTESDAENAKAAEALNIEFSDTNEKIDLEWHSESPDLLSYITSAEGSTVSVTPETISTNAVGEIEVVYTVADEEGHTKDYAKTFVITDTNAPEIEFKESVVHVIKGSEFDPKSNIASVIDAVEGDLVYSDSSDYSHYTVSSTVDTSAAGTYDVTVSALDSNGNKTDKSYQVVVE